MYVRYKHLCFDQRLDADEKEANTERAIVASVYENVEMKAKTESPNVTSVYENAQVESDSRNIEGPAYEQLPAINNYGL